MPMLVRNLRLGLDEPEERLVARAAKRLRVPIDAIRAYAPVRRSLDARDHDDVHFVYHLELALHDSPAGEQAHLLRLHPRNVEIIHSAQVPRRRPGHRPLRERPVIVGFGPAGMFAALRLAEAGYQPIVFERGKDVRRRHRDVLQRFYRQRDLDEESNLMYGEGGAGAYSDGKLYTRVSEPLVSTVLETLYHHGADPDILVDARPHIGSDKLPTICARIRRHIEKLGGEIRFDHRLDDVEVADGVVNAVIVNGTRMQVGPVVLAVGHSARDTVRMLVGRGVRVVAKPFQLGVRIEHPQELVDRWQYHELCGHERLPPAEYQLVAKGASPTGGDLFSFCMCPGGMILPSVESKGLIATNGASRSRRSGVWANSGLVITIDPETIDNDPLAGLAYQQRWERMAFEATDGSYRVPVQRAGDFLTDRGSDGALDISYPLGGQWCRLRSVIPERVAIALERGLAILDRRLPGFAGGDALLTAPETRASAPVRILRDRDTRESVNVSGLYPVGEGAGYAGGIASAAVDGLKTADRIIEVYSRGPGAR